MTRITRRTILSGIAAIAAPLPAVAAPAPVQSPEERLEAAIKELKAAAEAYDPTISRWVENSCSDNNCRIILTAFNF